MQRLIISALRIAIHILSMAAQVRKNQIESPFHELGVANHPPRLNESALISQLVGANQVDIELLRHLLSRGNAANFKEPDGVTPLHRYTILLTQLALN